MRESSKVLHTEFRSTVNGVSEVTLSPVPFRIERLLNPNGQRNSREIIILETKISSVQVRNWGTPWIKRDWDWSGVLPLSLPRP